MNLMKAFINEAQAMTKYRIFARIAKKEELSLISINFTEIAEQVNEHAYWIFFMLEHLKKEELIENVKVEIDSSTTYGTTAENLESAIKELEYNEVPLYQNIINIANSEGYSDLTVRLKEISQIKRNYVHRFRTLLKLLQDNIIFQKNDITVWKCMECGYETLTDELEEDFSCPVCGHLKLYFKKEIFDLANQDLLLKKKEKTIWICMECGFEVLLDKLPENWKCPSCKRSKEYFKRKPIAKEERISVLKREKATWVCLGCGNEEEVDLPQDWKCSVCGYPKKII
jgi:rubrerythrin